MIENHRIPSLDETIVYKRNSLGLRGEEPPAAFGSHLTIVTLGGSTTECYYLSEGQTWPDQLAKRLDQRFKRAWVNNAGMDGHATYENLVMLKDHVVRIKPKIALALVGVKERRVGSLGARRWRTPCPAT